MGVFIDDMDMQRFNELISLYLTDGLGPDEGAEFASLLSQTVYKEEFERTVYGQLESKEFNLEEPPASVHKRIQSWLAEHMKDAHLLPVEEEERMLRKRDLRRGSIFRWASAAAVLILLGTSAYYFWNRTRRPDLLPQAQRFRNDIRAGAIGATLVLADGSSIALHDSLAQYNAGVGKTGMCHIATAKGETYSLVLADGTKVWLNSASSLRYPASFNGNERRVELVGEAYFEVRHDGKKPFSVQLPDGSLVKDLGTRFNVHAYPDERRFRTTLVEGAVEVEAGGRKLLLKPGEQAEHSTEEALVLDSLVDCRKELSWKDNLFILEKTDLPSVMKQVERWYNAKIVYDASMTDDATQFFGAIPRNAPVSELLKLLELTGHVHFTIEGNTITVMK